MDFSKKLTLRASEGYSLIFKQQMYSPYTTEKGLLTHAKSQKRTKSKEKKKKGLKAGQRISRRAE